jgi:Tol biopolymer transport system component
VRAFALALAVGATVAATAGAADPHELIVFSSSRLPGVGLQIDAVDTRTGAVRSSTLDARIATVSPDGRRVAYIARRDYLTEALYVARTDGRGARLLYVNRGVSDSTDVTWSPDGKLIAFPFTGPKIGIVPAAGGRPRFIPDARRAIWSRDARRLAVLTAGDALDIVTLDGGRVRVAPDAYNADWSPDGRLAATISIKSRVRFTIRDLRTHRTVLRDRAPIDVARFSPDGRRVATLVEHGLYDDLVVRDLAAGTRRVLARRLRLGDQPAQPIEWSPAGDRVAVAVASGVVVAPARGGRVNTLDVRFPAHHPLGPPRWIGGRILVFTATGMNDRELYVADAATGRATALTRNSIDDNAPAISPDGRSVAFVRSGAVYVMSLADRRGRRLHAGDTPAWSPAGDALAVGVESKVEILDVRTGAVRRVVSAGMEPAWAPDGSAIAFTRNAQIWAAAPDGSAPHPVTSGPAIYRMPAYSPDGTRIACRAVRANSASVVVVDAAGGGHEVQLAGGGTNPSWSPDGTKAVLEDLGKLVIVNADGSGAHVFSPSDGWSGQPSWGRA